MRTRVKAGVWAVLFAGGLLGWTSSAWAQAGLVLTGAGPINRAMGGIATAPVDSLGALYWNPAVISGLPSSEMEFGAEVLNPHFALSSSLPPGALGPGYPGASGSTRSDNSVFALPAVGLVYQPEDSILSYGFGLFAIGGFGVNYPASLTNPILTAPPNGVGGPIFSQFQILQLAPNLAVRLTDRLSIGFGPSIDLASLSLDPGVVFPPSAAGYPPATHTKTSWGAGFQVGLYYSIESGWHFGSSLKSPQWLDSFRFQTTSPAGTPETLKFHANYPLIASVGTAYTGFERWTLGTDLRYIDFRNTPGFSQTGFNPTTGALQGVGARDVFLLALGAQYQITEPLFLRLGYTFATNPLSNQNTALDVAAPIIIQHTLYAGFSYQINNRFMVSAAYAHGFENSTQGPFITPLGAIPGSSVQSQVSADTYLIGATVKF